MNSAFYGGGLAMHIAKPLEGSLTIQDTLIHANVANYRGAGMSIQGNVTLRVGRGGGAARAEQPGPNTTERDSRGACGAAGDGLLAGYSVVIRGSHAYTGAAIWLHNVWDAAVQCVLFERSVGGSNTEIAEALLVTNHSTSVIDIQNYSNIVVLDSRFARNVGSAIVVGDECTAEVHDSQIILHAAEYGAALQVSP
eukprot:gene15150-17922_t